ncbi:MAG: hypothetical protein DIZ80_17140 [endosymbiont of Galathealinum brachiosum]|uniref:Porin domain-containing protein n=1 Tax=endosymbiont of Galathealinum brachiosum TaxID=2200906 RepID=A0A370D6W7_9GAMM|nr:MAG: hypothetical protein DIZ80_17140 [endosymbiont of Galathealinum brachiosum]
MKKIVLCAAVSAICAVPVTAMAEADFYGQLRISLDSVDADNAAAAKDGLTVTDNTSVFGFKAMSEGDGVKAFIHLQAGAKADGNDAADAAFTKRFYFGGLKGDFGQVAYGLMSSAYKMPGFKMDPFYNHSSVNVSGSVVNGAGGTYGLSPVNNLFTDNALQYTSPAMGGLTLNIGLYVDDSEADEHGTGFGAAYKSGNISAGVQYASNGDNATIKNLNADSTAIRVHGGYKADGWSAAISAEQVEKSSTTDDTYLFLVGKANISDSLEAAVTLGSVSGDTTAIEGTGITAGVFKTVAKKTQVFGSLSTVSLDDDTQAEPSVFSVGVIHKF